MSYAANPKAPKPDPSTAPQESTGAVAADSLAAESLKSGGEFSQNDNAVALGVKGAQSTLNTTDTSGATALPAARDGAAREDASVQGLGSDERGSTGVRYDSTAAGKAETGGVTTSQGHYYGGTSSTSTEPKLASGTGATSTSASGATGDSFADGGAGLDTSSSFDASKISSSGKPATTTSTSSSSAAATGTGSGEGRATGTGTAKGYSGIDSGEKVAVSDAPTYAGTVSGAIKSEGVDKPKGKNLVEGDIPQTKTFTGDVGGSHDPGRLAEKQFQRLNADGDDLQTAGGVKYDNSKGEGQFDALSSERAPDRNY